MAEATPCFRLEQYPGPRTPGCHSLFFSEARFLQIYDQYKKAPDVTRQRMYLETMERVLGNTDKIILDSGAGGVMPYLPLNELGKPRISQSTGSAQTQGARK